MTSLFDVVLYCLGLCCYDEGLPAFQASVCPQYLSARSAVNRAGVKSQDPVPNHNSFKQSQVLALMGISAILISTLFRSVFIYCNTGLE